MSKPSHIALVAAVAALVAAAPFSTHPRAATARTPALTTQSQPAATLNDPTIVAIFDAANTWDIEAGALAVQKSRNQDVRTFARMMERDHRVARQLGRDLAHKLQVTPTPPGKDFALYQDHVKAMQTLRVARGAAFDTSYINHEVAYHQAVIDAVTTQLLPATQNAELKDLEVKVAPNFQAHLAAAKAVQQKLASR